MMKQLRYQKTWRIISATLIAITFLLFMVPLGGCASQPAPYFEVGIGWNIDEMTDYWLKTEQSWTCDNNDTFHAELGLEWDNNVQLGYHHQSHVSCGGPFNDKPEVYQDEIILTKKWGGL